MGTCRALKRQLLENVSVNFRMLYLFYRQWNKSCLTILNKVNLWWFFEKISNWYCFSDIFCKTFPKSTWKNNRLLLVAFSPVGSNHARHWNISDPFPQICINLLKNKTFLLVKYCLSNIFCKSIQNHRWPLSVIYVFRNVGLSLIPYVVLEKWIFPNLE
jgi:hypothetical protein